MLQEKEFNLVEILKDAPKGTKLYSPLIGEIEFDSINQNTIFVRTENGLYSFNKFGKYLSFFSDSECLLFPSKENREWNTFLPFHDGEILVSNNKLFIYCKQMDNDDRLGCYAGFTRGEECMYRLQSFEKKSRCKRASKEERQQLFELLKEYDYIWNPETKKLETTIDKLDKECVDLVKKLNTIKGIKTTNSCCGHLKEPYRIFFQCNDFSSLGLLYRCVNRNYSDGKWRIECCCSDGNPTHGFLLTTKDTFKNEQEMNESVQSLIENIDYWENPQFSDYFKNDINNNI